jgi:hypothetical protein
MTDIMTMTPSSTEALAASIRGEVFRPGDGEYDQQRRVWNGSIDRHPILIVRCHGIEDVKAALRFARAHDLLTAVRGGGHSFPGLSTCDGGMVIDLGAMNGVRVDPARHSVRAQSGALLADLDRETQALGHAVPAGIVSHTGIAGLTLGGGIGWQHRKYGLTIDNLLSVDLITADGEFITASADENADLFWGVRGGGGNFGIVTSFEFRMNPIGPVVMAGPILWHVKESSKLLRFYREWVSDCPDELMTIVVQRRVAPGPRVPPALVGERVVGVVVCYAGPVEDGETVVKPLRAFDSPLLDMCEPKPFLDQQRLFDASFRHGCHYYVRSCDVDNLNDNVVDTVADYGSRIESPLTSIAIWQMGGAVSRVGDDETAFNGRNAGFTFNINGNTETAEGFNEEREWARSYWSALSPHHTTVYVNFLMEENEDRIRAAYGPEKYERLKTLKRKYDPTNFFRLNQNIPLT